MGAPYIYDVSSLRVNGPVFIAVQHNGKGQCIVQFYSCIFLNLLWTKRISASDIVYEWSEKLCIRSGNSEKFALSVQSEVSLELPNGLVLSGFETTVRWPFIILS